ncbi:Uncharacterised protein [Mycobacterium tuberculosis]|nr:Uncharacterised protein [Mycobacterium tuberculosis]
MPRSSAHRWYPHLRHIDDRGLVGAAGATTPADRHNPIAGYPVRGRALAIEGTRGPGLFLHGPQRRTVLEVGVEQNLQAGSQRGQFGPQGCYLVGGRSAQLRGQLAAQLRFQGQLVLPARRNLAIQLKVIDQLQVTHPGLIHVALPAVKHRHKRTRDRRPQRQQNSELEKFHAIGENQCGTGPNRQDQQRRQKHPTRPAAAAPDPGAAGQNGHGLTVPGRGQSACRAGPAIPAWLSRVGSSAKFAA